METKKITKETFSQPNAGEIILSLVKQGAEISDDCKIELFDLPNAMDVLLEYLRHGGKLDAKVKINEYYCKEFKLNRQLLHAWRLEFPELAAPLTDLSQKVVEAPVPELMNKIMQKVM